MKAFSQTGYNYQALQIKSLLKAHHDLGLHCLQLYLHVDACIGHEQFRSDTIKEFLIERH